MVLPVTYAVRCDEVIASLVGLEADRVIRGAVVAFEVDSYKPQTQEGWCASRSPQKELRDRLGRLPRVDKTDA